MLSYTQLKTEHVSRKLIPGVKKSFANILNLFILVRFWKILENLLAEYWHQFHEEKEPGYHKNKQKACKENGIKLIEVWENDWKKNNQQIKDLISKHLQI